MTDSTIGPIALFSPLDSSPLLNSLSVPVLPRLSDSTDSTFCPIALFSSSLLDNSFLLEYISSFPPDSSTSIILLGLSDSPFFSPITLSLSFFSSPATVTFITSSPLLSPAPLNSSVAYTLTLSPITSNSTISLLSALCTILSDSFIGPIARVFLWKSSGLSLPRPSPTLLSLLASEIADISGVNSWFSGSPRATRMLFSIEDSSSFVGQASPPVIFSLGKNPASAGVPGNKPRSLENKLGISRLAFSPAIASSWANREVIFGCTTGIKPRVRLASRANKSAISLLNLNNTAVGPYS